MIWTATPRMLFLGVVLLLIETPGKPVTLGQVLRETLTDGDGAKYFAQSIAERSASATPLSGACVRALNSYISIASDNTRSGVISSFRSRLELWNNPLVDAATSANDFDLRDLRRRRMSVYLGVSPNNLVRMGPLLNLFFQQLLDVNTRELPSRNKALKVPCLLLMDEFTALGKIPSLAKGIAYIAGYGLRMMPIIQSPAQLVEVYGKEAAQTFTTNHALNIIFPPKPSETDTARDISEWLGYQTVKGHSESKTKALLPLRPASENVSDQRRALMLPQEITSLGPSVELVVMENLAPVRAGKVVYFKDPVFMDRLKQVSPTLRSAGRALPSATQFDAAVQAGELRAQVPRIDLETHQAGINPAMPSSHTTGGVSAERNVIQPAAAASHATSAAQRALDAFDVDFSAVIPPAPGDHDVQRLNDYADALCRAAGISIPGGPQHG